MAEEEEAEADDDEEAPCPPPRPGEPKEPSAERQNSVNITKSVVGHQDVSSDQISLRITNNKPLVNITAVLTLDIVLSKCLVVFYCLLFFSGTFCYT